MSTFSYRGREFDLRWLPESQRQNVRMDLLEQIARRVPIGKAFAPADLREILPLLQGLRNSSAGFYLMATLRLAAAHPRPFVLRISQRYWRLTEDAADLLNHDLVMPPPAPADIPVLDAAVMRPKMRGYIHQEFFEELVSVTSPGERFLTSKYHGLPSLEHFAKTTRYVKASQTVLCASRQTKPFFVRLPGNFYKRIG